MNCALKQTTHRNSIQLKISLVYYWFSKYGCQISSISITWECWNFLETQILGTTPYLPVQKLRNRGPEICILISTLNDSNIHQNLRINHYSVYRHLFEKVWGKKSLSNLITRNFT